MLIRFAATVAYMKPAQLLNRICRQVLNLKRPHVFKTVCKSVSGCGTWSDGWTADQIDDNGRLTILNREKQWNQDFSWGFCDYGKLWNYRLNSFEYLNQQHMTYARGMILIEDFLKNIKKNRWGLDPYPTSQRLINWIKFFCRFSGDMLEHRKALMGAAVWDQAKWLRGAREFHLGGNHLLENGFALYFAGAWLGENQMLKEAKKLIRAELNSQILGDGGHVERSPMYHSLLLNRICDTWLLSGQCRPLEDLKWRKFLESRAADMLEWLGNMSLDSLYMTAVNDSTDGVAPLYENLKRRHVSLGMPEKKRTAGLPLGESGYRRMNNHCFQLLLDAGPPGPDCNPGHGHCDCLSFVLYQGKTPLIVDSGTSSYDDMAVRCRERSTAAHNTVMINNREQYEIWSRFRVGRRGRVTILTDKPDEVTAEFCSYGFRSPVHVRTFRVDAEVLQITDAVQAKKNCMCQAFFHFHPDLDTELQQNRIAWKNGIMEVKGKCRLEMTDGLVAAGFNACRPAKTLRVSFSSTEIIRTEFHEQSG